MKSKRGTTAPPRPETALTGRYSSLTCRFIMTPFRQNNVPVSLAAPPGCPVRRLRERLAACMGSRLVIMQLMLIVYDALVQDLSTHFWAAGLR